MTPSLEIERISNIDTVYSLKNTWNDLLKNTATRTIELTFEWQISFWEHFYQDCELFILAVREAGEIVAICPLMLTTQKVLGVKVRRLEIIAASESNFQDLIVGKNDTGVIACVLAYLDENRGLWDYLDLRHIPETSPTAQFFLENTGKNQFHQLAEFDVCTYTKLDTSWKEHKKSLSSHRKQRTNRKTKKIEENLGEIQLKTVPNEEILVSKLETFYQFHCKRWNATDTPSQFNDPRYCRFYSEVGRKLFSKGELGVVCLEAGDITLSQMIFLTIDKVTQIQLVAYDTDYLSYSPTIILLELFVDRYLLDNTQTIEWGTYYPWKELWANQTKKRGNLKIFPKKMSSFMPYFILGMYAKLRTWIKQMPWLSNSLTSIKHKIQRRKSFPQLGN